MYVFVRPALIAVQLVPLLLDTNTPPAPRRGSPLVPAKRLAPAVANESTPVFVRPVLTSVQLAPVFVLRMRPPPRVPANRYCRSPARAETRVSVNPESTAVQFVPL